MNARDAFAQDQISAIQADAAVLRAAADKLDEAEARRRVEFPGRR
jgi:hypothetical protein